MRLRHYFSDFINYGLLIDSALERPGQTPSHGEVVFELYRLLTQAEDAAQRAGYPQRDTDLAAHAVVAWVDERLAKRGMGDADTSLQKRRFGNHVAGNSFYTNLNGLPPEADEVREVFFLVLSFGFAGEYEGYTDRKGVFGRLLNGIEQMLKIQPVVPGNYASAKLTPQPYELTAPPPARPAASPRVMLIAIALLALLLPAAVLFWTGRAPALPAMTVALDPKPPLRQLAKSFDCADLALDIGEGEHPAVTLTGYVRSVEDREKLLRTAAQVPGVGEVTGRVEVHASPFCDILQIIKPYGPSALPGRKPITVDTAGGQRRLREGDSLELRTVLPEMSGFPTLIYVTATGLIQQIYPNKAGQAQPRPAGFVLEQAHILPPPAKFTISCPFGEEMIVALLSTEPLFRANSQEAEITDLSLAELRQVLERRGASGQGLFANHIFLATEAGSQTATGDQACRPR